MVTIFTWCDFWKHVDHCGVHNFHKYSVDFMYFGGEHLQDFSSMVMDWLQPAVPLLNRCFSHAKLPFKYTTTNQRFWNVSCQTKGKTLCGTLCGLFLYQCHWSYCLLMYAVIGLHYCDTSWTRISNKFNWFMEFNLVEPQWWRVKNRNIVIPKLIMIIFWERGWQFYLFIIKIFLNFISDVHLQNYLVILYHVDFCQNFNFSFNYMFHCDFIVFWFLNIDCCISFV